MQIEWDPNKARTNLRKHGVSFEEAATALENERFLVISHADVGDRIRIISARAASRGERMICEEG